MTMADELIAEGRAQGREEAVRILLRQLTFRYGPLSDETERRVRESTPEQRALWAQRVLSAATLDELFLP